MKESYNTLRKKSERIVRKGLEKLVISGFAFGVGLGALTQKTNAQQIVVSTQLPQNYLVADGTSEYKLAISVDSTSVPNAHITSTNWDVYLPPHFTFVDATLPDGTNNSPGPSTNLNDLFFPQGSFNGSMDPSWNFVDTTPVSGYGGNVVDANTRNTAVVNGPSNRVGDLEYLTFTVNTDAPLGPNNPAPIPNHDLANNFYVLGVNFSDITVNPTVFYNILGGVSRNLTHYPLIQTQSFTIGAGHIPGDFDGDGDVDYNPDTPSIDSDLEAFEDCRSGPSIPYTCGGVGDAPQVPVPGSYAIFDFDMDGDIDQTDFGALQRCMTGEGVIQTDYNCPGDEFSEYTSALNPHMP